MIFRIASIPWKLPALLSTPAIFDGAYSDVGSRHHLLRRIPVSWNRTIACAGRRQQWRRFWPSKTTDQTMRQVPLVQKEKPLRAAFSVDAELLRNRTMSALILPTLAGSIAVAVEAVVRIDMGGAALRPGWRRHGLRHVERIRRTPGVGRPAFPAHPHCGSARGAKHEKEARGCGDGDLSHEVCSTTFRQRLRRPHREKAEPAPSIPANLNRTIA